MDSVADRLQQDLSTLVGRERRTACGAFEAEDRSDRGRLPQIPGFEWRGTSIATGRCFRCGTNRGPNCLFSLGAKAGLIERLIQQALDSSFESRMCSVSNPAMKRLWYAQSVHG